MAARLRAGGDGAAFPGPPVPAPGVVFQTGPPRGRASGLLLRVPCVWTWRGAPGRGVGCDLPLTGRAAAFLLRRGGHWRPERQSRRPCCGSSGRRRFCSDREVGGRLPGAWRQVALSPLGVQKALPPDALWPDVHPARSPAPGHGAAVPPPLGPVMARFPCGRRPRRPSGPVCGAPRASPAPTGPEVTPSSILREVRELLFRQLGLPRWGLQARPQGAGSSRAGGQSRPGEGGRVRGGCRSEHGPWLPASPARQPLEGEWRFCGGLLPRRDRDLERARSPPRSVPSRIRGRGASGARPAGDTHGRVEGAQHATDAQGS